MSGVDHRDQYWSYHTVGHTGGRWWKYLFWSVMNISIMNSYILHTLVSKPLPRNRQLWSLKRFKTALVHQLCDGFTSRVYRTCSGDREVKELVLSGDQ